MFSIGKNFTAPTVKVDTKERKVEYHPRTYTQFIQGLKNRELPSVIIRPNKNIAVFQEENGDYGDVSIPQNELFVLFLLRIVPHAVEVIHSVWCRDDNNLRIFTRSNSRINRGKKRISNMIWNECKFIQKENIE